MRGILEALAAALKVRGLLDVEEAFIRGHSCPDDCSRGLIGDNAYDSDKLDAELQQYGVELIAPHRANRKNTTKDLRRMRRYRRRWKIERLFAWLQNFRRLVVRYERYAENFLGLLYLGCCLILLRHL